MGYKIVLARLGCFLAGITLLWYGVHMMEASQVYFHENLLFMFISMAFTFTIPLALMFIGLTRNDYFNKLEKKQKYRKEDGGEK